MSTRLLIGVLFFYVLAQVICNIMEGESYIVTEDNQAEIVSMTDYSETTTTEAATGGVVSFFDKSWTFISQLVFFDYALFYDIETGYTSATCATAGGTWQSGDSTCKIANQFTIIRILLMCIGVLIIIEVFLIGRRLTLG